MVAESAAALVATPLRASPTYSPIEVNRNGEGARTLSEDLVREAIAELGGDTRLVAAAESYVMNIKVADVDEVLRRGFDCDAHVHEATDNTSVATL